MVDLKIIDERLQQEINEKKHAEDELQGSEGEYRKLFEYSNDIIVQVERKFDFRRNKYNNPQKKVMTLELKWKKISSKVSRKTYSS